MPFYHWVNGAIAGEIPTKKERRASLENQGQVESLWYKCVKNLAKI